MKYSLLALLAVVAFLGLEPEPALPDLSGFTHVNTMVVPHEDNPLFGLYQFYLSPAGRETYQKAGLGGYPVGTTIVGKRYHLLKLAAGYCLPGKFVGYLMMVKAPDDPRAKDTGGWIFRQFDSSGRPKVTNGAKDCFGCHKPHPESDYVLSRPLE